MPNPGLKLTRLARSFWERQGNFPKFSSAPRQWEAGQIVLANLSLRAS